MKDALDVDIGAKLGRFELDVQFTVPGQGVTAIFGESGAGKTSLINAIAGIASPMRGHIRLGDEVWYDSDRHLEQASAERAVGYVFQDARLFPHLSVEGNLRYGLTRALARRRAQRIGIDEVVDLLGLGALLQRKPARLSGGERQRVALGRALLSQPRLLLMDEPLAALDAARKAEILPYIERLRDEFELPILYVSHSVAEITRLADHVVILSEGRSVASGALVTLMGDPAFASLIGRYETGSVLLCRVKDHDPSFGLTTLEFADGVLIVPEIDLTPGSAVRVRLRAREVAIATEAPRDLSISNQLQGTVSRIVEGNGPYVEVVLAIGTSTIRALITRQSSLRLGLVPGSPAWALIKSVALDRHSVAA